MKSSALRPGPTLSGLKTLLETGERPTTPASLRYSGEPIDRAAIGARISELIDHMPGAERA